MRRLLTGVRLSAQRASYELGDSDSAEHAQGRQVLINVIKIYDSKDLI